MILAALSFVVGLVGLVIASHAVVSNASDLGRRLGLAPMVIGLTIVAAGTSAPELAVVLQAVGAGDPELAGGSIVGSNIANVLLVLGLAATIGTIHISSRSVRADIPVMIGASFLFLALGLDGRLSPVDGIVLVTTLVIFVWWTVQGSPRPPDGIDAPADPPSPRSGRPRPVAVTVVGLAVGIVGLAIGARLVVFGAEEIAVAAGIPELIVGLTIVALGTSAPEIVTTIVAAARGQGDIAVGNAVGSCVFNILLVLGVAAIVSSQSIVLSDDLLRLDLPIMVAAAVACLPLVAWDRRLNRWEGAVFVAFYAAYLAFLALDATGHRAKEPFAVIMVGFVIPLTVLTIATVIVRGIRSGTPPDRPLSTPPPADDQIVPSTPESRP